MGLRNAPTTDNYQTTQKFEKPAMIKPLNASRTSQNTPLKSFQPKLDLMQLAPPEPDLPFTYQNKQKVNTPIRNKHVFQVDLDDVNEPRRNAFSPIPTPMGDQPRQDAKSPEPLGKSPRPETVSPRFENLFFN